MTVILSLIGIIPFILIPVYTIKMWQFNPILVNFLLNYEALILTFSSGLRYQNNKFISSMMPMLMAWISLLINGCFRYLFCILGVLVSIRYYKGAFRLFLIIITISIFSMMILSAVIGEKMLPHEQFDSLACKKN